MYTHTSLHALTLKSCKSVTYFRNLPCLQCAAQFFRTFSPILPKCFQQFTNFRQSNYVASYWNSGPQENSRNSMWKVGVSRSMTHKHTDERTAKWWNICVFFFARILQKESLWKDRDCPAQNQTPKHVGNKREFLQLELEAAQEDANRLAKGKGTCGFLAKRRNRQSSSWILERSLYPSLFAGVQTASSGRVISWNRPNVPCFFDRKSLRLTEIKTLASK